MVSSPMAASAEEVTEGQDRRRAVRCPNTRFIVSQIVVARGVILKNHTSPVVYSQHSIFALQHDSCAQQPHSRRQETDEAGRKGVYGGDGSWLMGGWINGMTDRWDGSSCTSSICM